MNEREKRGKNFFKAVPAASTIRRRVVHEKPGRRKKGGKRQGGGGRKMHARAGAQHPQPEATPIIHFLISRPRTGKVWKGGGKKARGKKEKKKNPKDCARPY